MPGRLSPYHYWEVFPSADWCAETKKQMELSNRQNPVQLKSSSKREKSLWHCLINILFVWIPGPSVQIVRRSQSWQVPPLPHVAQLRFSRAKQDSRQQPSAQTPSTLWIMTALGKGWAQHVGTAQKQSSLDRNKPLDRFSPVFIVLCLCEQPIDRCEFAQSLFTLHFLPFTAAESCMKCPRWGWIKSCVQDHWWICHLNWVTSSVALTLNARVRNWPVEGLAQWSDTNMFISEYLKHDTHSFLVCSAWVLQWFVKILKIQFILSAMCVATECSTSE